MNKRSKLSDRLFLNLAVMLVFIMSLPVPSAVAQEGRDHHQPITIFAAAGIRPATEELCQQFEKQQPCRVLQNYASSGTLARQIDNGAECDVFISANSQWVDYLEAKGLLAAEAVHALAGTRLAMITPMSSTIPAPVFSKAFDILSITLDKIALGDPTYVPVGNYTQQVLSQLGWLDKLKGRTIMAKDVSAVLHYVELAECDWGIVYYTEAFRSSKVKILAFIPDQLHEPIVFYMAKLKAGKKEGQVFTDMFLGSTGRRVLAHNGFTIFNKE